MLKAIMSTWTLFFGLLLISAGSGLQVVLLGTRAPEAGFTNIATGVVMSGYFAGIFVGSECINYGTRQGKSAHAMANFLPDDWSPSSARENASRGGR